MSNKSPVATERLESTPNASCCSIRPVKTEEIKAAILKDSHNLLKTSPAKDATYQPFARGETVMHITSGTKYEFGSALKLPGMCILYEPGHQENANYSLTTRMNQIRRLYDGE